MPNSTEALPEVTKLSTFSTSFCVQYHGSTIKNKSTMKAISCCLGLQCVSVPLHCVHKLINSPAELMTVQYAFIILNGTCIYPNYYLAYIFKWPCIKFCWNRTGSKSSPVALFISFWWNSRMISSSAKICNKLGSFYDANISYTRYRLAFIRLAATFWTDKMLKSRQRNFRGLS